MRTMVIATSVTIVLCAHHTSILHRLSAVHYRLSYRIAVEIRVIILSMPMIDTPVGGGVGSHDSESSVLSRYLSVLIRIASVFLAFVSITTALRLSTSVRRRLPNESATSAKKTNQPTNRSAAMLLSAVGGRIDNV